MSRVIRLTESDLTRIVKQVINEMYVTESEMAAQKQQVSQMAKNLSGCFSAKKFPNLYKAANGSMQMVMGLVCIYSGIVGEIFSFGLSTLASIGLVSFGGTVTYMGAKKVYDANISKIRGELSTLYHCLF